MAVKTVKNDANVTEFLESVDHKKRREDSFVIRELMERVTGEKATMWGTSIVGFGSYHYKYASGLEGDWPVTGFSPRKTSLSLYIMSGFSELDSLLSKLGKFKTGKSCLYVNKLEDINLDILEELVRQSVKLKSDQ